MIVKDRIGEILLKEGLISEEQLQLALKEQKKNGERIGYNLINLGILTEEQITSFLAKQWNLPIINLNNYNIPSKVIKLLPAEMVIKHQVIPIDKIGNILTLAMVDPANIFAINDIKFMTGCEVEPVICSDTALKEAIVKYYENKDVLEELIKDVKEAMVEVIEEEKEQDISKLKEEVEDAPVVKLVNLIISEAIKRNASDIHIEPYEDTLRVRYRIDGVLYTGITPPVRLKSAVVSRIKIMAELDIAERRLPQDGRIKIRLKNKELDLRVSVIPSLFGEKVVLRILDKSSLSLSLETLGFEKEDLKKFEKAISFPHGIILITGPTGSGKTTTLYSALHKINSPDINILTVEDPVEYNLMGINQVQTKADIGLTFAHALRSFLRQDPDVMMVGEIRDYETIEIAIRAALTGHLVLSSLHTNDAPSAIVRLLNMKVEDFLITSTLIMIVAQRLLRKICPECKEEIPPDFEFLKRANIPQEELVKNKWLFYQGKGCNNCANIGYKGRVAIYEVMPITSTIKKLILEKSSLEQIIKAAKEEGMRTLKENALLKLKQGITTVEEIIRVITKEEVE